MEILQCRAGHYYVASQGTECPYCKMEQQPDFYGSGPAAGGEEEQQGGKEDVGRTIGYTPLPEEDAEKRSNEENNAPETGGGLQLGRTMSVAMAKDHIDPVVGWLVCIDGSEKGKDYRIHSDHNYIGSDKTMEICISGDNTISRKRHARITYDRKNKVFYMESLQGRNVVYVNEKPLLAPIVLASFDKIEIGMTKLMFVPLCGENFDWKKGDS